MLNMSIQRKEKSIGAWVSPGKYLRFPELYLRKAPLVVCPVDDLLIFGPEAGLERPQEKIRAIIDGRPDAILTFAGCVSSAPDIFVNSRYILNLTASTSRALHTKKVRTHTIEEALRLNACAVAAHINMRSKYAPEMIEMASSIISEANRYHLPTVGIIYPRGENGEQDDNMEDMQAADTRAFTNAVAHCLALGASLGFDAIKTKYTGDPSSFSRAIQGAQGIPVLVAGGSFISENAAIETALDAVKGGAAGISFGRNVFGRNDAKAFIARLRKALK